jgi:hypothetical protein
MFYFNRWNEKEPMNICSPYQENVELYNGYLT